MIVLAAVLALASAQVADARLHKEIQSVFNTWERRWAKKDVERLAAMMHPSGQTIDLEGRAWPFSRARQDLPAVFAGMRNVTMDVRIDHLERTGPEVVAWITTRTTFETKAENGKWVRRESVSRDVDTLRKFSTGWKFVYSQALP